MKKALTSFIPFLISLSSDGIHGGQFKENEISHQSNQTVMTEDELEGIRREIDQINDRLDSLERDIRLLSAPDLGPETAKMLEIKGGFFETMQALRALYLDQEEDVKRIRKISADIEKGRIRFDMTDLFFRFFVRQEIQNARVKLLILSQRLDIDPDLFDQLDDLSVIIDDPRYSVHQVIIGWKRFERTVGDEIRRLSRI
jgi:hypothetical protein